MMPCENHHVMGCESKGCEMWKEIIPEKRNEKIDPILRKLVNGLAPHLNESQIERVCK